MAAAMGLLRFIHQPIVIQMERTGLKNASGEGSAIKFGPVPLEPAVEAYRHEMNAEMMAFLRSLPKSKQTDAVVFLLKHCRTSFLPQFDFFANYYPPAWSVIHWLEKTNSPGGSLNSSEIAYARTAHAMALFLHPLDDHLADGQLPSTPLHVLLRSQAWTHMNTALEKLSRGVPDGGEVVKGYIDDYYASIESPPTVDTLDGYCRHFLKQMATGMIVPALMAAKINSGNQYRSTLEAAYGAFGIAWRLLDDLQDMDIDQACGCHSAVYYLLPAPVRSIWDQPPDGDPSGRVEFLRQAIHQGGIVKTLRNRIAQELTFAASRMASIHMEGLARELHCLAAPIVEGRTGP
jgi:hypothetical protein